MDKCHNPMHMPRELHTECHCASHSDCHCTSHSDCHCASHSDCHCKNHKHNCCHNSANGLCSVVVDDANNTVYIYGQPGSVLHENYHVPGSDCLTYASITASSNSAPKIMQVDEFFEGEHSGNNISLQHTPSNTTKMLVFLNGLKQRNGSEYDYTINGNIIHFNTYNLLATDVVEVMYEYGVE